MTPSFTFKASCHPAIEDDEFINDVDSSVTIQVTSEGYVVVKEQVNGRLSFGREHRTLRGAKIEALSMIAA